jgi:hypothetical protein
LKDKITKQNGAELCQAQSKLTIVDLSIASGDGGVIMEKKKFALKCISGKTKRF